MNAFFRLQLAITTITATGVWGNLYLNHPHVFRKKP